MAGATDVIHQFQNNPFSTNLRPSMDLSQIQDLLGPIDQSVDHYKKTDMQHLSDVFRGQSEYLGSTILNAMLDQNAFIFQEILPMKFTQQLHVKWNIVKMTKTLAEYSADQSVPNMTEAEVQEDSTYMVRRGIGMRMDHAAWSTPAGKREYVLKAAAMVRAVREVVEQTALLTLLNTENNYGEMYTAGHDSRMFDSDRFFFGLLQKEDHGLYVLNKELKNWFQRSGVVPDSYLVPPRMLDFAQLHPSESNYSNAGGDSRKNLKNPNKSTLGFGDVYEVAPVDMDNDPAAIEPLNRHRTIGGYFAIRDFGVNRRDKDKEYKTKDCNTQVYCAEDDAYHTFSLQSVRKQLKDIHDKTHAGDMHYYDLMCMNDESHKRYADQLGNMNVFDKNDTAKAAFGVNKNAATMLYTILADMFQRHVREFSTVDARVIFDLVVNGQMMFDYENSDEEQPESTFFQNVSNLLTVFCQFTSFLIRKINTGSYTLIDSNAFSAEFMDLSTDQEKQSVSVSQFHQRIKDCAQKQEITHSECLEKFALFDRAASDIVRSMFKKVVEDYDTLFGLMNIKLQTACKLTQEQVYTAVKSAAYSYMKAASDRWWHGCDIQQLCNSSQFAFNPSLLKVTFGCMATYTNSFDPSSAMAHQYAHFMSDDIPMPFSWIMVRPQRTYRTGSIIACRRGAALGCTLYGYPDFQWANDVIGKTMTGHLTFHHSAAVIDPNATMTVHDTIVTRYERGENHIIYDCDCHHDEHNDPSAMPSIYAYPVADPYYGDSTVSGATTLPAPLFFGQQGKESDAPKKFLIDDLAFQIALNFASPHDIEKTTYHQAVEHYKNTFKPPFESHAGFTSFCFQEVQFMYVGGKRMGIEDQGHLTSQQRRPGAKNMLNGFFTTLSPIEMHPYV